MAIPPVAEVIAHSAYAICKTIHWSCQNIALAINPPTSGERNNPATGSILSGDLDQIATEIRAFADDTG